MRILLTLNPPCVVLLSQNGVPSLYILAPICIVLCYLEYKLGKAAGDLGTLGSPGACQDNFATNLFEDACEGRIDSV